jgi:rSAM/selenodomain-associated transferase 2
MTISVIIPVLNEEGCIAQTIRNVREGLPHEIIVVDGGSIDATCKQAAEADLVLRGPRGRAPQMNQGAAEARGEILLFLHADCRLERGALAAAERVLSREQIVAGCFRMRVEAEGLLFRMIDACATARVRLTGIMYGDQGLCIRRKQFQEIGGFPSLRLMEDVFISLRLRKLGRIVVAPAQVYVSARRWQRQGIIQQTLRNWALTALAMAGTHPDNLARYYPIVR